MTERPKKPAEPIHVASVDLEKRAITISGDEPPHNTAYGGPDDGVWALRKAWLTSGQASPPAPRASESFADISRRLLRPMDETVPVALWRTCPALSWSSCDECPLPIACLSVAQCALAPLEEETP
jgi:hypothetical protein